MNLQSLNALYLLELHALYSAEQQILKALPRLINAANSAELKAALSAHRDETELHVNRLEEVFEMHAERTKGETSAGMHWRREFALKAVSPPRW